MRSSNLRFSYSKLSTYETCPRMFYYTYLAGLGNEDNFYSQYGTFIHELIDKSNRYHISGEKLLTEFADNYEKRVTCPAPTGEDKEDAYYYAAYDYFSDFKEVVPGAELIASEKKHVITLNGNEFSGIIDMVVRMPDGSVAIVDHKSTASRSFYGKSGDEKYRQLYLYAEILRQKLGILPNSLMFNCFREKRMIQRDFDLDQYHEVLNWANCTMEEINQMVAKYGDNESEWMPFRQFFWCDHICGVRAFCNEEE